MNLFVDCKSVSQADAPGNLHPGIPHPFDERAGEIFFQQDALRPAAFPFWQDAKLEFASGQDGVCLWHLLTVQGDVSGEFSIAQPAQHSLVHFLSCLQADQADRTIGALSYHAFHAHFAEIGTLSSFMEFWPL